MKTIIIRAAVIAVILAAGFIAVFNIPDAVESFLPAVETIGLSPEEYRQTVSGTGKVARRGEDWYVTVTIGERDIRQVAVGQTADISGAAFDDGIYTATVHIISSIASTLGSSAGVSETAVEVSLLIDNPDSNLRHGYTARADIVTGDNKDIYTVPYSAILQDDVGEYVFVLSGNTAVRRDILTGIELPDSAQVVAGLTPTDRIIADPLNVVDGKLYTPRE